MPKTWRVMGHPVTLSAVILIYRDSYFICSCICVCVYEYKRFVSAPVLVYLSIYIFYSHYPLKSIVQFFPPNFHAQSIIKSRGIQQRMIWSRVERLQNLCILWRSAVEKATKLYCHSIHSNLAFNYISLLPYKSERLVTTTVYSTFVYVAVTLPRLFSPIIRCISFIHRLHTSFSTRLFFANNPQRKKKLTPIFFPFYVILWHYYTNG